MLGFDSALKIIMASMVQSFFSETDLIKQECAHTHLRSNLYSCFVEKGRVPGLQFLLTATLYKELD